MLNIHLAVEIEGNRLVPRLKALLHGKRIYYKVQLDDAPHVLHAKWNGWQVDRKPAVCISQLCHRNEKREILGRDPKAVWRQQSGDNVVAVRRRYMKQPATQSRAMRDDIVCLGTVIDTAS